MNDVAKQCYNQTTQNMDNIIHEYNIEYKVTQYRHNNY